MPSPEEEMYAKVAVNIITEIFKSAWKTLPDLANWIEDKNKEHDFFGTKAKEYARKLEERYNYIRVLGMDKPVPLRKMLVRVNILEKITERQSKTIEELKQFLDHDKRGFGYTIETKEGSKVVNELKKFIILGKPGAGKTTYLKSLLLQSLDGKTKENRIPVFITLKDFADSRQSLLAFMVEQFDICRFPEAMPFITRILEKGKFQILLDGLDEVSKEYEENVIREIIDFSDKYSENQFVVSCRIAAYNYRFHQFTDVEVADFNNEQIRNFIGKWFLGKPQSAEKCWNDLEKSKQIRELASTPLLLVLLCLAYEENLTFPPNRSELYKDAILALLKKWDTCRGIQRDEIYQGLSPDRKLSMFSRIAAETFEKEEYFIKQDKLKNLILNYIQNLPGVKEETLPGDSEAVLKAIEAQHGIFVQRAKGIYSFSHLTFQEYFTAKYIVDKGTTENLINTHLLDNRWREIFLLTTSMFENADKFLMDMKVYIDKKLLNKEKLYELIQNVYSSKINESFNPSDVNRALVIFFVLALAHDLTPMHSHSTHSYSYARARDLAHDFVLTLARNHTDEPAVDLAVELVHFRDLARDLAIAEAREITEDLAEARTIAKDLSRNSTLISAFLAYLQANQLLVDCLSTECYVTKSTRQNIMNTLFAP